MGDLDRLFWSPDTDGEGGGDNEDGGDGGDP